MNNAVNTVNAFSLSSLVDIGIVLGIICGIGIFLLYKGRVTAVSKR